MVDVPVLETARLKLRGHCLADFNAAAEIWSDEVVTRFLGRPFTPEESWSRLLRYVGHWDLLGYGFWAITEKASGRFIGEGGICDFRRDITWPGCVSADEATREIGWALGADYHGQGLATEAVQAVTTWADRHFRGRRTICIINPSNQPSIRVAEKCGYGEIGTARYKDNDLTVFARAAATR
ncbi:MAG: GNAT family N-acetyltransferase [Proteobacteria bacterium]|nr:GNAT family N-acetyltransferase [Pseudomonadota bacterium]